MAREIPSRRKERARESSTRPALRRPTTLIKAMAEGQLRRMSPRRTEKNGSQMPMMRICHALCFQYLVMLLLLGRHAG